MDTLHALLSRQVRRHFGTTEGLPEAWQAFVEDVNEAYRELDVDRGILERALEISSEEQTQANAELRATLQAFPDLFFRLDAEGRILGHKAGFGTDAFLPGQSLVGKRIQDVPNMAGVARKFQFAIDQMRSRRSLVAIEYPMTMRTGEEHYEARFVPLPKGEIFVIVRNITERKQADTRLAKARAELEGKVQERTQQLSQANASLRQSEEWVRNILTNVQAGIMVVEPKTREVLDVNPVALSMMGRTREEVVGQICHKHVCPSQQGRCPVSDLGQTVDNAERVLLRADGTTLSILKTVVPVVIGGRQLLLESFVDISVRKRVQVELEEAKRVAEAASEAKSQFLAMMSHEIRTPLNGVTSALHLIQNGVLSPQQQRWIDMAFISASTLLRVINDVLDFSKVEAGKLDLRLGPTRLADAIGKTVAAFAEKAAAKGLAWRLHIDPAVPHRVETDADRLAQVLSNLLDNAVKFTDAGTVSLRVRLHSATAEHARVRFEVVDTGVGINPVHQQRLFKPFSQVDSSTSRRHGGTGLGLGICRQLVELMGGAIGVESAPGQGSTFWFELPFRSLTLQPEVSEAAASPVRAPSALASPASGTLVVQGRVLLAEDNEINRELARELIQASGCVCDCVSNGRDAVRAVTSGRYDLVFMDCMMPEIDGYAATRAIRAQEASPSRAGPSARRLPIVALTANAMEGDRRHCLAVGMDDYLSKPLDPEAVAGVLRKWLPAGPAPGGIGPAQTPTPIPALLSKTPEITKA